MRELAQKRLQKNFKQSLKYLTLVFNDFFILALIFLFGALMFWYAKIMKQIPTNLWFYRPVLGLIITIPLFLGRIVTLLKPADLLFLLPQDSGITAYLKPMYRYSCLLPFILEILALGIMFPFAIIKAKLTLWQYLIFGFAMLLGKMIDLKLQVAQLYFGSNWSINWHKLFILLFAQVAVFYPGISWALLASFSVSYRPKLTNFNWQKAVELEQNRKQQVYGLFSMFTDVKEKSITIKRRKYLDFLLPKKLAGQNPNSFLYLRSIIRNPEYANLLFRMTLFAVLLSFLVQELKWATGLSCLVIFLTAYQLLPLINEFDQNIMYRIYPIDMKSQVKDLLRIITPALLAQALTISISWLFWAKLSSLMLLLVVSLFIFSLLITYLYLPIKAKKLQKFRRL